MVLAAGQMGNRFDALERWAPPMPLLDESGQSITTEQIASFLYHVMLKKVDRHRRDEGLTIEEAREQQFMYVAATDFALFQAIGNEMKHEIMDKFNSFLGQYYKYVAEEHSISLHTLVSTSDERVMEYARIMQSESDSQQSVMDIGSVYCSHTGHGHDPLWLMRAGMWYCAHVAAVRDPLIEIEKKVGISTNGRESEKGASSVDPPENLPPEMR